MIFDNDGPAAGAFLYGQAGIHWDRGHYPRALTCFAKTRWLREDFIVAGFVRSNSRGKDCIFIH
jgi:hypothetical protein